MAADWKRKSVLKSWAISLTKRWNGSFLMSNSVDFWYLLISRRATVPGRYLWGFLTPPVDGADFLAAFVANCFLGALPPVDLRAVCLVRAMFVPNAMKNIYFPPNIILKEKLQLSDYNSIRHNDSYSVTRNQDKKHL